CDFGPLFQLEHAHSFRLKYNMLAVIQLPVSRQDASFALQPLVQRRVGEGSHDCKTRQVDFRGDCEFRRFHKNVGVISIQTKNKASLQGDSMIVKLLNNLYEPIRGIESLSAGPQVFWRDGFQPHQKTAAATVRRQFKQLGIVRQQNRGKTVPLQPHRNERLEQPNRIITVGDQVQVHENELARAVPADILNYVVDRLLVRLASPRSRHNAEIAVVNAAARGLEDVVGQVSAAWQEVAARERTVGKIQVRSLIVSRSHPTFDEVAQ